MDTSCAMIFRVGGGFQLPNTLGAVSVHHGTKRVWGSFLRSHQDIIPNDGRVSLVMLTKAVLFMVRPTGALALTTTSIGCYSSSRRETGERRIGRDFCLC